jgi:hypothetical protein
MFVILSLFLSTCIAEYLLATVVVGNQYATIAEVSLKSLNCHVASSRLSFTLLVLTTNEFMAYLHEFLAGQEYGFEWEVWVPSNESDVYFLRYQWIYWPRVHQFTAALYFDTDVVFTKSLDDTFLRINEDRYYVAAEAGSHTHLFFGLQQYTQDMLDIFAQKSIRTFNAGVFAIRLTCRMLGLIDEFLHWASRLRALNTPAFGDQSYINTFMNTRLLATTAEGPLADDNIVVLAQRDIEYNQTLLHFIEVGFHVQHRHSLKLRAMQQYLITFLPHCVSPRGSRTRRCVTGSLIDEIEKVLQKVGARAAAIVGRTVDETFARMGHIGNVPNEVRDYAAAALLPGVRTICEVGFNAGHSAAVFLLANTQARYIVFDMQDLPWSHQTYQYISEMFPGRTELVPGNSHTSIAEYHVKHPLAMCDLWSIDGDHEASALIDFEAARLMSARHGYVLADDHTSSFPAIKEIWRTLQQQGKVQSLHCRQESKVYHWSRKGWCLGRWIHDDKPATSSEQMSLFHTIRDSCE